MNTHRLLHFTIATLLLAAAGFWSAAVPAFAQEADAATDPAAAEDPDSDAGTGEPSVEVFIPTEEISEDFAVSFPVDI